MQLKEALSDIAEIRALLDKNQAYRGFRSLAIGISAVFVLAGSVVQLQYPDNLIQMPAKYLDIWLCVAVSSLLITAIEMIIRGRKSNEMSVWKMHGKVAIALLPSFVVGALVTATLVIESRTTMNVQNIWLLPGLWALIYSLGLFSCCNLLHRTTRWAACYYLLAGSLYLILNWTTREIHAWHMVVIFGVGQLLLAAILYWKVERRG